MSDNRSLQRDASGSPDQVDARLVIRLLGEVAVSLDGYPLPDLTTLRLQRLLGRLALASTVGLRRDRLAYQLWPDSTEPQARTNLRKLFHDLRRSLPDANEFLDVGNQTIRWHARAPMWVDVVTFSEALKRGDAAAAVRHYGGPLLPACYDDWVLEERERLRTSAVDALARLAASANDHLRDDDVVEYARHLLRIDPLHEPTYQLLMEALARRGDRGEALRTYHRCVTTLEHELGVAPAAATVEAYHRLSVPARSRQETASASIRSPLIGRDREWSAAHAAWRAAAGGVAHFLLVTGEAGVGKTRLVEELAGRAAAEGYAVARSRAYQAAGSLPWGPVADWLRSEAVRPGVDGLDPVWLAELARLLPELRMRHPRLAGTSVTIEATRRHVLLDAVRRGLLAAGRPLLLVVDDLQWCDRDTLDLCGFLLQRSPEAPLLVAGTARDDEISDDHPLASLLRHLLRDSALTAIPLERLGPSATAELAAVTGGRTLEPDVAARLWKETEGNPLFVVEAVRAGFGTDRAGGHPALTPTVQTVISARLDRLSPFTRRLLEIAATIGREFPPRVLACAAGSTEDGIADALDELWQRQVVREHGAAYDFSHDKLREVVLGTISPARRRTLHRSVAAALEEHCRGGLGPVSARLGTHYERAGLDAQAVEAYERAAEHAYQVFALDDAIALQQQALGLLDRAPRSRARDEIELRLRSAQGVALAARRGYGATALQRGYDRALTLHRRLGRPPSPSLLRGLALHAVVTCRFARASELGQELVAAGCSDRTALVEGNYVLGVTHFWRGEFSRAEHHLTQAIEDYQPADSPLHIACYAQDPKGVCLSRLALTQLFRGQPKHADETMEQALRHVTELDHPMTTAYVYAFDAFLAALDLDNHDMAASVAALRVLTAEMHIGYFEPFARMLEGWRDVLAGDLGGIDAMREVTDSWLREQPLHLTFGLSLLARAYLCAGDLALGRAVVADALRWTERTGQAYLLAELLRIDAELLALGDDRETAGLTCGRALDVAREQGSPFLSERIRATLASLNALEN